MGFKESDASEVDHETTVRDNAGAAPAESPALRTSLSGWEATILWTGGIIAWYAVVQMVVFPSLHDPDPAARALMLSAIPMRIYQYSEAAFFTAAVLNLIAFIFEETSEKRQLALLSSIIKGLSWHCDYLIVTGQSIIVLDGYGALMLPSRYVQWSCTTPTILFTLSKITDFTPQRTATAMLVDWFMILTGYLAAMWPPGIASYFSLFLSYLAFVYVLFELYSMIESALTEAKTSHARMSLNVTRWVLLLIFNMFPIGWMVARMGPGFEGWAEPINIFANFAAKVVFSSCILFNNFVTIQQRRVAAQIEQEQRERIIMVADLKTAVKSKDEFISVIGHELRTPLNAIIQLSSAMSRSFVNSNANDTNRSWLDTITRSATHLLGIINDIITLRAARSGMHIKQELVYTQHIVDHVIRQLSPMAKRGVVVEKMVSKQLPPIVADERRIIQMLSNLLGNALKFTDKGKVTVRVFTDRNARNIIIKIRDTGCGIPQKDLSQLLVPFKQADMSTHRKFGGTGLGLSIAHQLIEAHSGKLELESKEGDGTTVMITLPVLQLMTRKDLEEKFTEAYTAAGFNIVELMSAEAARQEGRPRAMFSISLDGGQQAGRRSMSRRPRHSMDSSASSAVVDQYMGLDDMYNEEFDDEDEGGDISAAAMGQGGPPPMAVALVSSFYTSEQHPTDRLKQLAGTRFTTQALPSPSIPEHSIDDSMSIELAQAQALTSAKASPPSLPSSPDPPVAVVGGRGGAKETWKPAAAPSTGNNSIDDPRLSGSTRNWKPAPSTANSSMDDPRFHSDNSGSTLQPSAAAGYHNNMAMVSEHSAMGTGSSIGQPPPQKKLSEPSRIKEDSPVSPQALGGGDNDGWHQPSGFDDHPAGAEKGSTSIDNGRLSYELRTSLDFQPVEVMAVGERTSGEHAGRHMRKSGSFANAVKSVLRKSLDLLSFSSAASPKLRPGSSAAGLAPLAAPHSAPFSELKLSGK